MARVVYRDENYQTFYVDVNAQQPEVTIGRNPGNKVLIPAKSLSRYHAKIVYQNGRYFLYDLKSSNGTYVNNARINQQEIKPGDKIRFGDVAVEFIDETRLGAPAQQPKPHPVVPQGATPQQGVAMAPQGGMAGNRPMPPAMPGLGMPKLNAPMLQVPQYGSNPDLRSVSMRPISSHGTYRPTMPNQPVFDDEMAKVAAEQVASSASNALSASAAPMSFNPNSMGIMPGSGGRNLVAPHAPDASAAPINPPAMGAPRAAQMPPMVPGMIDPSVAPMGFNPNSMGMSPAGMPAAPAPQASTHQSSDALGGVPAPGMIDPSVAPMSFNPNSMGMSPAGMPSAPAPQASLHQSSDALGGVPAPGMIDPSVAPMSFNPNSMGMSPAPEQAQSCADQPEQNIADDANVPSDSHPNLAPSEGDNQANSPDPDILPSSESNIAHSASDSGARQIRRRNTADGMMACDNVPRRASRAQVGRASNMHSGVQGVVSRGSTMNPSSGHHAAVAVNRSGRGMQAGRRGAQHYTPRVSDSQSDAQAVVPAHDAQFLSDSNEIPVVPESATAHQPAESPVDPAPVHDESIEDNSNASGKSEIIELGDDGQLGDQFGDSVDEYLPEIDGDVPDSSIDDIPRELLPNADHDPERDHGANVQDVQSEDQNGTSHIEPMAEDNSESSQNVEEHSQSTHSEPSLDVSNSADSAAFATERESLIAEKDAMATELASLREQNASIAEENAALKTSAEALQTEKSALQSEIESLTTQLDELRRRESADQAAAQAQSEEAIEQLKEAHEREIDDLNIVHASELGNVESERDDLKQKVADLEGQLQQARDAARTAEDKNAEAEKGAACAQFVPRWASRFNALLQYAKVFERAVEKLGVEAAEPKTTEYVRSMVDMIRFCADDLNDVNAK